MGSWVTTALIVLPAAGALVLWALPWPRAAAGVVALVVSLAEVGLWIAALVDFDFAEATSTLQYEEQATWFGDLGVSYHVGFLGIGLWLAGLAVVCQAAAVAYAMRSGRERPRAYYGLMLLLTRSHRRRLLRPGPAALLRLLGGDAHPALPPRRRVGR